jgi:uncharacterized membrane protein YidH (DUF202 family)
MDNLKYRMPKKKSLGLLSRDSTGTQSGENLSSHEPVQVEPKTYFANERTFIQWISAALLLLTVSSIMMGSGSYNGTSSVIAFSSLVLVCYASYVYFRRVNLLRSGDAYGYLDFVGPTILAAGVGLGVFIVFADAVKGSEFLPWGNGEGNNQNQNDRRFLMSAAALSGPELHVLPPIEQVFQLQEVEGKCSRHSIEGINLLEYQPRDIILHGDTSESELMVATPQALVSHPLLSGKTKASLSASSRHELPDTEIQSMTMVGDRLFALSIGPSKTELIEFGFNAAGAEMESRSRFLIQDSTTATGSMVIVPSSVQEEEEEGKLYIYLDGTMHNYHLPSPAVSSSSLSRTGSINMKVLNRGLANNDDPITAMEHFEGLTYILRERQNTIEAWDLNTATFVTEMPLPSVSTNDKWVGMAFQRRRNDDEEEKTSLRKSSKMAADTDTSAVYLHMPLDAFPPQLWSFRLDGHGEEDRNIFSFPECE